MPLALRVSSAGRLLPVLHERSYVPVVCPMGMIDGVGGGGERERRRRFGHAAGDGGDGEDGHDERQRELGGAPDRPGLGGEGRLVHRIAPGSGRRGRRRHAS